MMDAKKGRVGMGIPSMEEWEWESHSSLLYGILILTLPFFMGFPFPLFPSLWDSHSHSSLLYGILILTLPFFMGFPLPLENPIEKGRVRMRIP
jgi:hypothetical protein